jgi:phosphinothricin acetyltransferase
MYVVQQRPPARENTVIIRPATRADLPGILEIYNEAVLNTTASADYEPQTLDARTVWFDSHVRENYPIFVAEAKDGRVVGWSSLSQYQPRVGYRFTAEDSVYVAADRRGQGIGKQLMPPLIEAAQQCGLHSILGRISADNTPSLELHASFGFEPVAQLHQVIYKFGRWIDLIYMELLLDTEATRR